MKTFGSILSFTSQRNAALLKAFREQIKTVDYIKLHEITQRIVNSPAPRFWVSEERAAAVISAMMRGIPVLEPMRPPKREMFLEIYRRVIELKESHPDWPLNHLVFYAVNSPAPKFYMEASSARQILFKIRNGWYNNDPNKIHR